MNRTDLEIMELEERFWPQITRLLRLAEQLGRPFDGMAIVIMLPDSGAYSDYRTKLAQTGLDTVIETPHGTCVPCERSSARKGLRTLVEGMGMQAEELENYFSQTPVGDAIVAFAGEKTVRLTRVGRQSKNNQRGVA